MKTIFIVAFNEYGSGETDWLEIVIAFTKDTTNQDTNHDFPTEIVQQIVIFLVS